MSVPSKTFAFFFGNVFVRALGWLGFAYTTCKGSRAALKVQGSLPERKPQCCQPSWDGKSIAFS